MDNLKIEKMEWILSTDKNYLKEKIGKFYGK